MGPANATRLTGLIFEGPQAPPPGPQRVAHHCWHGTLTRKGSNDTVTWISWTQLQQMATRLPLHKLSCSVDATVQPCSVQVTFKPDMRFQVVAWFRVNAHTSMMHFQRPSWKMAWIVIALGILLINLLSKLVQSWQVEFASCFTQNASMRLPALEGFLWVKGMWCLHKKRQRY